MKLFVLLYASYLVMITAIISFLIYTNNHKVSRPAKSPSIKKATKLESIIRLVNPETGKTFCSGTVITENLIVTAAHCLVECEPILSACRLKRDPIEIRTDENNKLNVTGKAVWATTQLDQGLIRGDFSKFEHRGYTTDIHGILDTRETTTVYISCGYPMGGHLFCTPFTYENIENFGWSGKAVLIPAMSGGPVMTPDGRVIGVNVAVEGINALISPLYNTNEGFNAEDKK